MTDAQKVAEIARGLSEALDGDIRALSIRQPWCHHILHDGKDVENRDWPTRYRGWFLIHAGKATDGRLPQSLADVARGGIVGAARITDCVSNWHSRWWMGRYGFVLADPVPIPLIPCKGALGFFRPEDATIAALRDHLKEQDDAER